jgi:hypothetical protein
MFDHIYQAINHHTHHEIHQAANHHIHQTTASLFCNLLVSVYALAIIGMLSIASTLVLRSGIASSSLASIFALLSHHSVLII